VFGGEGVLAPDAAPDDGAFELVPIAGRRDFTSKLLATLRHSPIDEDDLRKLGIEHSRPVRASSMVLTVIHPGAEEPPAAQIDGEEFPAGDKFRVDVLPRLLRVLVPA
jgi:diacylglycerol kinase family enzyme